VTRERRSGWGGADRRFDSPLKPRPTRFRRPYPGARRWSTGTLPGVTVARSIALFVLAAVAEIGGAWLVWQGVREHRGWVWIGLGVIALGAYGFVATLQPDPHFGRILAAYGGVFVAGSLAWGMVADGFRPDRYDVIGALICLVGVAVIMYAPRAG
jgi:small multidrug resistance family-3 protein